MHSNRSIYLLGLVLFIGVVAAFYFTLFFEGGKEMTKPILKEIIEFAPPEEQTTEELEPDQPKIEPLEEDPEPMVNKKRLQVLTSHIKQSALTSYTLGRHYESNLDHDTALLYYRWAYQIDPTNAGYAINLCERPSALWQSKASEDTAKNALVKAIEELGYKDPRAVSCIKNMISFYEKENSHDKAQMLSKDIIANYDEIGEEANDIKEDFIKIYDRLRAKVDDETEENSDESQ